MKVPRSGRSNRQCDACGVTTATGPDPCLGFLPGVSHACCGHGDPDKAYVVLGGEPDQSCLTIDRLLTLRGENALAFFGLVKQGSENPLYSTDVKL